jgi:hypothetical protein
MMPACRSVTRLREAATIWWWLISTRSPSSCRPLETGRYAARHIAALTAAAFDYDAPLRLAASLDQHHEPP